MQKRETDLTIFVACYNEEENIIDTLETTLAALEETNHSWEIIIIDDASSDNSVKIIKQFMEIHQNLPITLKVNQDNRGLAFNYIEAAFLGRGKYYRLIAGDNVQSKETMVTVNKHLGEADMIITAEKHEGRTLFRSILSKTFTVLVNIISGYNIQYYNGSIIHLRYNVMRWHPDRLGFGFHAELITSLLDEGFSYVEVPIFTKDRSKGGSSALTLINFLSVTHSLLEIGFRRTRKIVCRYL